jgi:hypothetical protein
MAEGNTSRTAGVVMIVGGLALAALTFMTWYEIKGNDLNAWDALRRTDVAIFGAGIVAAACGGWLGFGDPGPEGRFVAALATAAGALAALVVVVRIVSPPGDGDVKLGIFLALLAALAAAVGGLMALSSRRSASPAGSGPSAG